MYFREIQVNNEISIDWEEGIKAVSESRRLLRAGMEICPSRP